jgi:cysteine desulfurase
VPSNINITIPGLDEDSLLTKLDLAGFAVSSGSSCNSGSNKKSNISKILNRSVDGATIRISLGKQNTIEEVSNFCKYLHECVKELSSF